MANLKNIIKNVKNFYVYLIALLSSVSTFVFFYYSNKVIKEEKIVEEKIDIYKVAKEEAIKLGRLEPDEKPIVQEIGPDGKVIIPSLTYVDIGGLGENSNKGIWTRYVCPKTFIWIFS